MTVQHLIFKLSQRDLAEGRYFKTFVSFYKNIHPIIAMRLLVQSSCPKKLLMEFGINLGSGHMGTRIRLALDIVVITNQT